MTRTLTVLTLIACVAAPAAWAATPINETRPLDARGHIEIENLKGRIQVRTWDRKEVKITGSLGKGVEKLVIEGDESDLVVKVEYPRGRNGWRNNDNTEPTDLILNVPVLAELEIDSVSATVDVVGTAGESLQIDSVSGDVTVAGAPREADIESVSGDLNLTLNTRDVSASSVSGDLRLRGKLDGEMSVETVSGNIDADSNGKALRRISASTVSGDVRVRAGLQNGGELKAESVSGDLHMTLPKNTSAQVSGETFSGDLTAPGAKIERPKYGPGASFEHRYGSGSGLIRIETFSGDGELVFE
ncbi:DUF4124 domain containing protein [Lysobacter dokdonensis DS-58]|uniref:DUF4124 domain containing protein n=1 Tax=Lysobacter dokdonensis DS-58 TaxID=1300345 RepID=A0A0A2X575_9GAMM|nr:DUF4097 family beta strand repeat-containing protein [Lysobacter dokdonensis]KGQ20424.1 DUF4124 domain containing protein [Lysobacter dokdonensis DS-58]